MQFRLHSPAFAAFFAAGAVSAISIDAPIKSFLAELSREDVRRIEQLACLGPFKVPARSVYGVSFERPGLEANSAKVECATHRYLESQEVAVSRWCERDPDN